MAQRSNQRKTRSPKGDQAPKETIASDKAKGQTIVLSFTMQNLVDEYMLPKSAEERESFWATLGVRLAPLSDEQKALFALSCSNAHAEVSESLDQVFAKIDHASTKLKSGRKKVVATHQSGKKAGRV